MAEIFNFNVQDNRSIQFPKSNLLEPIMQEDHNVAIWRFRIPKVLNNIDMSAWAWWFVYVNAKGQKFTELLTLVDDIDEPDEYCTADYNIDYRVSYNPGSFAFSLESINADATGAILQEWHTKTYHKGVDRTLQGNQAKWSETESDIISALIIEVQNKVAQLVGGATPEPKNLVADMTDPQKVYLYVGNEENESNGYWYYHNGTRFVPGGLYASSITVDSVPTQGSNNAVRSGGVYEALAGKVDAETGKGLSTNDYTNAEKQKVTDASAELSAMTTATTSDAGKALKAKTVTDGKVTEWEFGTISDSAGGDYGRDMVQIPNIVIDPMFGDLTDENAFTFTNCTPVSDGDGVLSVSVTNKVFDVRVHVTDTASTDILFYSVKIANNTNWSMNMQVFGQNVVGGIAKDAERLVDGVITGGTGKYFRMYSTSGITGTFTITMPIVVNLTAVFGAGHEPTYTQFKAMLENWERDEFGEWISRQKYDAIIGYPKWYAQNLLVKTSNSASIWNSDEKVVTGDGSADYIKSNNSGISNSDYSFDGDVIYLSAMVKASGSPTKFTLAHTDNNLWKETAIQNIPTADAWYHLSSIDKQVSTTVPDYRYMEVRAYYADATAQSGQTLTYKCGLAFNLTRIFGKGNEPTDATVIDAMLSQYTDGWFAGSQNIWNPSIIKWLAESYKTFANGTYYGSDGKRFKAGSIIDRYDEQWSHAQSDYGMNKTLVPVDNQFEGGIRTNGMVNVFPKYGRWERGAAGANTGSLFGGHVFEAWNNIRSYRLTMMMGHGGDKVSYTDENEVVHETPREDEACIIVYSPANSYANPPVTPSEEQSHLRINKAQEDYYGDNPQNMLGRIRIGGDTPTQGTVFTKNKLITYGRIILADTTQENKGKQLVFNNDGTVTWTEVTLYQHPEPAPVEEE